MEGSNVNNSEVVVTGHDEMLRVDKKHLFWQRLSAFAMMAMFLTVFVAALMLIPQVIATLNTVNRVAVEVEEAIVDVNTMVDEMTVASTNLNKLVDENAEGLTEAVTNLSNVDFEGLNKAIQDLQDAIGPMATLFNKFR
jgi:hypothetical protein